MGSGQDQRFDPWVHLQKSQQMLPNMRDVCNLNYGIPIYPSAMQVFSPGVNPYGQGGSQITSPSLDAQKQVIFGRMCGRNAVTIAPVGPCASKLTQTPSAFKMSRDSIGTPAVASSSKRFVIFDQSGSQTRMMFGSVSPLVRNQSGVISEQKPPEFRIFKEIVKNDPAGCSDETSVCKGTEYDSVHEDTDEIEALLCSDSDDEEESSTRYSPIKTREAEEDVASSGVPTKRRRLNQEKDPSLMDTASSTPTYGSAEWSYIKGRTNYSSEDDTIRSPKKDRIHETLRALQHIIPGGVEGKDPSVVLEEAITYLKYLKAKALQSGL